MKPAISVILLTTLIGAAQGLFLAYYSAEWLVLIGMLEPPVRDLSAQAATLAVGLLLAGLGASFFHLGHPERAWRAAAMWRTSWLSREVIALPAAMSLIGLFALVEFEGIESPWFYLGAVPVAPSLALGFAALLAVLALYVCTAMIYTCLKFLRQWHSPLTVLNFFLMGAASGFSLAALVAAIGDDGLVDYFASGAILLTLFALAGRAAALARNRRLRPASTLQSAIGIQHPNIRQIAQGAMGGSFNTRAFIHAYGPAVVRLARQFFLLAGFALPALLLALRGDDPLPWCSLAFGLQFAGLLVERWYFFIEAEHPQNVYYQMIS